MQDQPGEEQRKENILEQLPWEEMVLPYLPYLLLDNPFPQAWESKVMVVVGMGWCSWLAQMGEAGREEDTRLQLD